MSTARCPRVVSGAAAPSQFQKSRQLRAAATVVRQHAYSGAVILDFARDHTSVGQAGRGDENLSPARVHRLCVDDFVSADCRLCRVT
jgi:hypothetical protein